MSADSKIRVGVIGCGQFMSRQHIQTVNRSPFLQLQHLATRNPEKVKRLGEKYKAAKTTTNWQEVVSDPEVDVVVVGVVPQLHPEIAQAALANNKPVYVEKPLAETPELCLEIQRMAWDRGLPLAVGFNRRFAPAAQFMLQAFQAAGAPTSVIYRISDDDRVRPPAQQWKLECRLLIEIVHIFDLLAYLFEAEPVSIYARETRFNDGLVTLTYENGCQATILSSSWGTMAQPKEHMEAVLDRAAMEMDDFVEVRTFGIPELPTVCRFAGRPYDDCDNGHVDDFARRGLAALLDLRQRYNQLMLDSGVLENSASGANWDRLGQLMGDHPLPQINYAADKGWGAALEHFCQAAMEGKAPRNATAIDGNRATACAVLGRKSIEAKSPIELNPQDWLAGK